MSVWKERDSRPEEDWISGGIFVPQYRPIRGDTADAHTHTQKQIKLVCFTVKVFLVLKTLSFLNEAAILHQKFLMHRLCFYFEKRESVLLLCDSTAYPFHVK